MTKENEKPKEIIELEERYDIVLNETKNIEDIQDYRKNNIYFINERQQITGLNLSDNNFTSIPILEEFKELRNLNLSDNRITEIQNLDKLTDITYLNLSDNQITEIKNLEKLNTITKLSLAGNKITEIQNLDKLTNITDLNLSYNQIAEIKNLNKLTNTNILYLSNNQITEIQNLDKLTNIIYLDLSENQITEIKNLDKLTNISNLDLSENQITEIKNLDKLTNINILDLSKNQITEIQNLDKLTNISNLDLSENQITEIKNLDKLTNISNLDLSDNQITEIKNLKKLKKLSKLYIHNNPLEEFYNVKLNSYQNHLWVLEQILNTKNTSLQLPSKILLLGNHASGKSSFLNYFITDELKKFTDKNSTHILKIETYKNTEEKIVANIYDFGGQDYYHGIYKAFLTNDSINVLFWNSATNRNQKNAPDSKKIGTINFTRNYWLHQLQYYYTKNKNRTTKKETEPILLVQTHADVPEETRDTTNENTERLNIKNEFFISLDKEIVGKKKNLQLSLAYLKEEIKDQIGLKSKADTENKNIYDSNLIKVIKELQQKTASYEATTLENIRQKYIAKNKKEPTSLIQFLEQFSRKGMLLFYPEYENIKTNVWLHPEEVVSHLHKEVLTDDIIKENKGVVAKQIFEDLFKNDDKKLIDVLLYNQVIFLDETIGEDSKYIIPGYLPLADTNDYHYFLFDDLRQPNLTLKFEHFIPFGFMNRLICFYGGNPEKKLYWKDQLLFTTKKRKAKVLIQLDFENLTIKTSIKTAENANDILKEVYFDIIALYWDEETIRKLEEDKRSLEHNFLTNNSEHQENEEQKGLRKEQHSLKIKDLLEKNKIPDAYLSINGRDFIKYDALHTEKNSLITSYKLVAKEVEKQKNKKEIKETTKNNVSTKKETTLIIDKDNGKSIPISPFKHFTFNENLTKMKKIFISYSKKDLTLVNTFQDHLSALQRDGKVGTWYCTELLPGDEWDKKIQQHFDESDIVCFMVSPNFMKTDYIYDYEVAKAFENQKDPNIKNRKKIVPIILDFCAWRTEENNLGKYNALPYTAKPIKDFKNENMAWYTVVESLRLLIDNNFEDFDNENYFDNLIKDGNKNALYKHSQLRNIFERLIAGKLDV